MARLTLSLGLVDNCDTTISLARGSVTPQGIDFTVTQTEPPRLFRRQAETADFDVCEMSISTYLMMRARGEDLFLALPVFPRRSFRHGFVFVNTSTGVHGPADLAGKRIGLPEYQQTAAMWIRSILRDEYEVDTAGIEWVVGGLHERVGPERYWDQLEGRVRMRRVADGETLNGLLEAGEIEAVIGAQRPRSFGRAPQVQRLFPDFRAVEQTYYEKTGYFPLMHLIVVRRSLVEVHPWIVRNICDAFEASKRDSDVRLRALSDRACALPWLQDDVEEIERVFGGADYRPYGLAPNRAALAKMAEMSFIDGLSPARLEVDALFAEASRSWRPASA
jgi:4,5-dihydroxyphthalate decarboxylase